MPWSIIIKSLVLFLTKRKFEVSREKIYDNVSYLPVLYFFAGAPAFFLLVGLATLTCVGVAEFFPEYLFPENLTLAIGGAFVLLSLIMFGVFKIILKGALIKKNQPLKEYAPLTIEEKIKKPFSPILEQFRNEHNLMKESFIHKRN